MNLHHWATCGLLVLPLVACSQSGDAPAVSLDDNAVVATEGQSSNTQNAGGEKSVTLKFQDMVPRGYRLLESLEGDLDADGIMDVLMAVEDESNTSQVFGEGAQRKLLICKGEADGRVKVVRESQEIIPCKTCGGVDGPYFELQTSRPGRFSVIVQGGSRERWTTQYDFSYDKPSNDWLLAAAHISLMDSGQEDAEPTIRNVSVSEISERRFSRINSGIFPEISVADESD